MTRGYLEMCIRGVSHAGSPGWLIQFEYDMVIVEEIKSRIPHTAREWNPHTKTWWVSEAFSDVLDGIFLNWRALAGRTVSPPGN